jgi:hypothetical protein
MDIGKIMHIIIYKENLICRFEICLLILHRRSSFCPCMLHWTYVFIFVKCEARLFRVTPHHFILRDRKPMVDWMIDYLLFYVPLKNISLIWRRHHYWWRAAKFRPMLGAQGLWAGRDLYRATPTVTRDLGFFGLIRRTALFGRLLRHTRGCGGSILTRILTGWNLILKINRQNCI